MSRPNYNISELDKLNDDFLRRKIDEHYRVHRLVQANGDMLSYKVIANDPKYPHPPVQYKIKYFLTSYVDINETTQEPIKGMEHELSILIPRYYPDQSVECIMTTDVWHPNIKSKYKGLNRGEICTNTENFGTLYTLDELIVRIGKFLQYKKYLAENIPPYPEDEKVAKWVRDFAEPNGYVDKEKGKYIDDQEWVEFFDDDELYTVESEEFAIDIQEAQYNDSDNKNIIQERKEKEEEPNPEASNKDIPSNKIDDESSNGDGNDLITIIDR